MVSATLGFLLLLGENAWGYWFFLKQIVNTIGLRFSAEADMLKIANMLYIIPWHVPLYDFF